MSPASRAIPPIVKALTGLWRGIVTMRWPSVMTLCLPLASNPKTDLLQHPDGDEIVDAREARHVLPDLDLAHVGVVK